MKQREPHVSSDLMDLNALCAYLGKCRPFIYKAMREEGLPARRMGSRWTFSKSEVDDWFKSLPGVNLSNAN